MAQASTEDWFSLGYGAHSSGLSQYECPYPSNTSAHDLWCLGWSQARFADIDENVLDAPRAATSAGRRFIRR